MVLDWKRRRAGAVRLAFGRGATRFLALGCAVLLAGCVTDANVATPGRATLAFESVDGPPRPVFDKLVAQIDAQAKARDIAVVSREGSARYRVRAYLAATLARGKTLIDWVWDVYDADGERVTRLAGQEPAGPASKDAWTALDGRVLDRIAEAGMAELAAFASGAKPATATAEAETAQPAAQEPAPPAASEPQPGVRVAIATPSTAAAADSAH